MDDPRPILIVDDDLDDIFFAQRALKKGGVSSPILTCVNGREVVTLLQRLLKDSSAPLPRVIFLDIKMPEMGGFEALKWIRAQPRLGDVAVFMLSGSKETRDTELAESLGADGYLVKYPTPEEIAIAARNRRTARRGKAG